jgi:photosystem II stability/assembly factor-like uncharacterized protein
MKGFFVSLELPDNQSMRIYLVRYEGNIMVKRMIILLFLTILLGSCGIFTSEREINKENNPPQILDTESPTDTPFPSTTPMPPTLTPADTTTATSPVMQPTLTQQLPILQSLPTLRASQTITITQISMVDTMKGWAIGHQSSLQDRILFTLDGGFTWSDRTPPLQMSPEQRQYRFQSWGYFFDEQTAWVIYLPHHQPPPISNPVIWFTSDSGYTWEASDPLPLTGGESFFIPENFAFISSLQGWLLVHVDAGMSHDYSNLYATTDGGRTWQRLIDPYIEGLQGLHNTGLAFANSDFGWVSKDNLAIMPGAFLEQTLDGGLTWEEIFLPEPGELDWFNEISQCATSNPIFLEGGPGIVLTNCQTFDEQEFSYTYISSDKGQSWQATHIPSFVQSLSFINNQIGWAFGRDIYKSSDGGLSWVKIKTVSWDGQFNFVDENSGWAIASSDETLALVYSRDGGKTWQLIEPKVQ